MVVEKGNNMGGEHEEFIGNELYIDPMSDEVAEETFGFMQIYELTPGQSFLAAENCVLGGESIYIGPNQLKIDPFGDTAHSPEDDLDETVVICDANNIKDDLRELVPEPLFLGLPTRLEAAVEIKAKTGIIFSRCEVLAGFYLNGARIMHDMNTGKHVVFPSDRAFLDDENYRLELDAMGY